MKDRLYLDNCCFNRPYDDPLNLIIRLEADAKVHIQKQIHDGQVELAWSYILDYENAASPYEDQKRSIARWKRLAVVDIGESRDVIEQALVIAKHGIQNKDALHIACAIKAKCRCFLTTDKKILRKRVEGITLLNPLNYIQEVEGGQ